MESGTRHTCTHRRCSMTKFPDEKHFLRSATLKTHNLQSAYILALDFGEDVQFFALILSVRSFFDEISKMR